MEMTTPVLTSSSEGAAWMRFPMERKYGLDDVVLPVPNNARHVSPRLFSARQMWRPWWKPCW